MSLGVVIIYRTSVCRRRQGFRREPGREEDRALRVYPKDDTSGCTREAEAFRNLAHAFAASGAVVLGLSRDSVASHEKFKAKHALAFPLVSDKSGAMCQALGVWVQKSMYGKRYMGIERSTFLIDKAGGIFRRVWRKVKAPGHAAEVLAAAQAL